MYGPVEWSVLIFICAIVGGSLGIGLGGVVVAWRARGLLADYELKYDRALAVLHNEIQDRNFLLRYDLDIADLTKDVRHAKGNLEYHAKIYAEMHDQILLAQFEVARLGKLVNGAK